MVQAQQLWFPASTLASLHRVMGCWEWIAVRRASSCAQGRMRCHKGLAHSVGAVESLSKRSSISGGVSSLAQFTGHTGRDMCIVVVVWFRVGVAGGNCGRGFCWRVGVQCGSPDRYIISCRDTGLSSGD